MVQKPQFTGRKIYKAITTANRQQTNRNINWHSAYLNLQCGLQLIEYYANGTEILLVTSV